MVKQIITSLALAIAFFVFPAVALAQSSDPTPTPTPSATASPSPTATPQASPTSSPASSASPSASTGGPDDKNKVLGASTSELGSTGIQRDFILLGLILIVGATTLIFGIKTVRNKSEE